LIHCDIHLKARSIICDFHGTKHSFLELEALMLFLAGIARQKRIFRVEMIVGRGRQDDIVLLSYRDLVLEKLEQIPFVSHWEIQPNQLASGFVFWFSDRVGLNTKLSTLKPRKKKMSEALKALRKELKKEEEKKSVENLVAELRPAASKTPDLDPRIQNLESLLEMDWNEKAVMSLLKELDSEKRKDLEDQVLDMVADFEIYFSEGFRKEYIRRSHSVIL